ncbi:hypothetical protein CkaCkLH20_07396 [Colletotrichum karsti]|uniref:Heterokaryon incompatibility domain-containing protein n=1 Tax=Colletotrichum karsti TaxID=1095194 RepID=A0A9P6LJP4_9PEZI|nr:uncharacterized protein CkaCkLH20_07396 [Colletotrichum karsti]KAF9875130.1 hypothetical protein CkaCkLH20_07396 [Colletotrichum karsti]
MRLINVKTRRLEQFHVADHVPPYAILSHTWGADGDEISFSDIEHGPPDKEGPGRIKFDGCCRQAEKDNLEYAWIDTCCINKDSSTELEEAINSMFRWYRKAELCYAFLADVASEDEGEFRSSRWFERGWTLQELLAPKVVEFYSQSWGPLGSKTDRSSAIEQITGIPVAFLTGTELHFASVAQRMSWASKRKTTKTEDLAYCLLGIFNISMKMLYGEEERAFLRLQEEILGNSELADDSILAWDLRIDSDERPETPSKTSFGGILAESPARFANCGNITYRENPTRTIEIARVHGHLGLRLILLLNKTETQTFGLLNCSYTCDGERVIGIPLCFAARGETADEYMRPANHRAVLFSEPQPDTPRRLISVPMRPPSQKLPSKHRRFGFKIQDQIGDGLQLSDVEPHGRWERETSFIITGVDLQQDSTQRTWLRYRQTVKQAQDTRARDFVVMLELKVKDSRPSADCHLMTASAQTSLSAIATSALETTPYTFGNRDASNGSYNLRANVSDGVLETHEIFSLTITSMPGPPAFTVDLTTELTRLDRHVNLLQSIQEANRIVPRIEALVAPVQEKRKEVDELQAELKKVRQQLKRLEDQKRQLSQKLNQSTKHLDGLKKEDKSLRRRRDELYSDISTPELSAMFGNESAPRWHSAIVNEIADRLPKTDDATINEIKSKPQRVLMQAIATGHKPAVKFLITRVGNLDFTDTRGRGVLSRAVIRGSVTMLKWLLSEGAKVNATDSQGLTALSQAALGDAEGEAKTLLDHNARIEHRDSDSRTPAIIAAQEDSCKVLTLLLKRGAKIEAKRKGHTPLSTAVTFGSMNAARVLVAEGADIHATDQGGWTLLNQAVRRLKFEFVEFLLDERALIEAGGRDGWTPLLEACGTNSERMVKLLLDRGANIEAPSSKAWTPITYAISRGYDQIVEILLERGANIEAPTASSKKWTPLTYATFREKEKIVEILLQRDAKIDSTNAAKQTSLCIAAGNGSHRIAQLLVEKGANIEFRDELGRTPLILAAETSHGRMAYWLVGLGAQVDARNKAGETALFYAARAESLDILRTLSDKKADINAKAKNGQTALYMAVQRGNKAAVQDLLKRKADILLADQNGQTPLQYARGVSEDRGDISEILELLQDAEQKLEQRRARSLSPRQRNRELEVRDERLGEAPTQLRVDSITKWLS